MTVDQEEKVGKELIAFFDLEPNADGRYQTPRGQKSVVGLCRTVKRIFDEQGAS